MKTRSVLLYYPGYPFDPKALLPSRSLAGIAGSLLEQGHETRILDYGTVETVARLVSGKPMSHMERVAGQLGDISVNPLLTLRSLWHMRSANKAFREQRAVYAREIANRLSTYRGLHFLAFMLNAIEDLSSTLTIARALRELRPRLKLVAFGEMASLHGESLASESDGFDCVCTEDPESTLVALAERIDTPQHWHSIANLAYTGGSRTCVTRCDVSSSLSALPAPAYEPDVYPALKAEQKLRIFTIEESRPFIGHGGAAPAPSNEPPRIRSVASVCNEMWRVGTLFGARAFHFPAEAVPASHVSAVAHELLRRGAKAIYSRSLSIANAFPAIFPALYSSGCVSLSFPVDSGSQRLLDTFYGRRYTVTDVERTLRCAKSIGIFTIARFTYPCPADDYHTRAETLRLIERTRPGAIALEYPQVSPNLNRYTDATLLGYNTYRHRAYRDALAAGRKFPVVRGVSRPVLPESQGAGEYEAFMLHNALVKEIEQRGITVSCSDEMVRLACIVGDVGREAEFANRAHVDFTRGDAMGIATLVDLVNEVACVSAKRMALRAPDAERLAVGN